MTMVKATLPFQKVVHGSVSRSGAVGYTLYWRNAVYTSLLSAKGRWEAIRLFDGDAIFVRAVSAKARLVAERHIGEAL